jgi:hypothetical protein
MLRGSHLSAEFSKTVHSPSSSTSRVPLFDASYFFDERLYKFTNPKLTTNGLSWNTISIHHSFKAWLWIRMGPDSMNFWIQIRIRIPDPNPGASKWSKNWTIIVHFFQFYNKKIPIRNWINPDPQPCWYLPYCMLPGPELFFGKKGRSYWKLFFSWQQRT